MAPDAFSEQHQHGSPLALDPTRPAVLVVDMVNEFFEPGGKMVLEGGTALYTPVNTLLDAAHTARLPVFYTNQWLRPDDALFKKRIPHCLIDTWGARLVDAVHRDSRTFSCPNAATARSLARTLISIGASARSRRCWWPASSPTSVCARRCMMPSFWGMRWWCPSNVWPPPARRRKLPVCTILTPTMARWPRSRRSSHSSGCRRPCRGSHAFPCSQLDLWVHAVRA